MTPTGRLFLAKPSLKLKFFHTPFAIFQFWCSPNTSHTKHAIYFMYSISLLLVSSYGNQALDGSEFACFVCAVLLFFIGFIVWSFRCKLCAGKNTWLVYLPVLSTHLYCLHKSMDECRDSVRLLDVACPGDCKETPSLLWFPFSPLLLWHPSVLWAREEGQRHLQTL